MPESPSAKPRRAAGKSSKPSPKPKSKTTSKVAAPGPGRGRLVIVESPAKARTIGKYLGSGYTVKASMGHVRDLPKSTLGVDVDDNFAPTYLVPRDKTKLIKELKESVQKAREVYLATDPDREGEAIAWHLIQATGASAKPVHRVVFHEITPQAVSEAMASPRGIDPDLVDAQQARRVLDRLVGYKVSPLLWKKVKRGLSAGRVQTAALRLVVDRERQILDFVPVESWTVDAVLHKIEGTERERAMPIKAGVISAFGKKAEPKTEGEAQQIIDALDGAVYRVQSVKTRESLRRPQPPFTTSTLQQEASRKLGFQVRRTMQIAQELYEGIDLGKEGIEGLIT